MVKNACHLAMRRMSLPLFRGGAYWWDKEIVEERSACVAKRGLFRCVPRGETTVEVYPELPELSKEFFPTLKHFLKYEKFFCRIIGVLLRVKVTGTEFQNR